MLNRLTGVAALLAALLAQCLCTARAELSDVQQLADKVDAPSAMKIYLNGSDIVGTNSIPTDAEFDNLMRELQDLEARHPEAVTGPSPTQEVAQPPVNSPFRNVAHRERMLSLDNVFSVDELRDWLLA